MAWIPPSGYRDIEGVNVYRLYASYVTSNASDRPTTDRLHSLALPQPTYLGLRGIIMKALLGKCGVPLPQREGTLPGGECAGSSFGPG